MFRLFRSAVVTLFAASLLLIPGQLAGVAQEATPMAECPVTTPEENEAIVTMYWEEAVWGDQGTINELVAPNEIHHWGIGGDTTGFEEFSERWDLFLTAFPDLEFTVDLVTAEGEFATTLWTATGTHRGEWLGIPPTDREVTWRGINVFRIECGQIVESWGAADHLGLLSQITSTGSSAAMATPAA